MKDNIENKGPLVRIIKSKLNWRYYIQIKRTDDEWHETANGPFDCLANARRFEKGMHKYLESSALMNPCNNCLCGMPLSQSYNVEVAQCAHDKDCFLAYCNNCGVEVEHETMDEAVSKWNSIHNGIDKEAEVILLDDKYDDVPF
jgi:hypothetical protein